MRTDLFTPCLALGIKKGKAFALPYCIKKARPSAVLLTDKRFYLLIYLLQFLFHVSWIKSWLTFITNIGHHLIKVISEAFAFSL